MPDFSAYDIVIPPTFGKEASSKPKTLPPVVERSIMEESILFPFSLPNQYALNAYLATTYNHSVYRAGAPSFLSNYDASSVRNKRQKKRYRDKSDRKKGLRCLTKHTESRGSDHSSQRQSWRPLLTNPAVVSDEEFSNVLSEHSDDSTDGTKRLHAALSLLAHGNPRMSILEVCPVSLEITHDLMAELSATLNSGKGSKYCTGIIDDRALLAAKQLDPQTGLPVEELPNDAQFDLIILQAQETSSLYLRNIDLLAPYLTSNGVVIGLADADMPVELDLQFKTIVSRRESSQIALASVDPHIELCHLTQGRPVFVVEAEKTSLGDFVEEKAASSIVEVKRVRLDDLASDKLPKMSIVVSLLELAEDEGSQDRHVSVREIIDAIEANADILLRVTSSKILGLSQGLSEEENSAEPSKPKTSPSKAVTVHLEGGLTDWEKTSQNLRQTLILAGRPDANLNEAYLERDGLLHVWNEGPVKGGTSFLRLTEED